MQTNMRWNIFARVLEDILIKRNLNWQVLSERAGIEQDTVDRLQASLLSPTAFPILTVEELAEVTNIFNVLPDEKLLLRAAIIATSVESMLMERIESQAALLAAEQVFDITYKAFDKQQGEKQGDAGPMSDDKQRRFFEKVAAHIDKGTTDRQMCNDAAKDERITCLKAARHHFEQARDLLKKERPSFSSTRSWQNYDRLVQKEYDRVNKELKTLER